MSMRKCMSTLMALIVFFCGTFLLSIQAQAAVSLMPIGLNYTVKDVDVGNSFTLRATVPQDSMGILEWSSSDSSIASVADSGSVTGHKLGTAVITASYTTAGGNVAQAKCTVYVTIADGYSIMYLGDSDRVAKPVVAEMPGSYIYLGHWDDSLKYHPVTAETLDFMRTTYANRVDNVFYFSYQYQNESWTAHIREKLDGKSGEIGVLESVLIYLENGSGVFMKVSMNEPQENLSAIAWVDLLSVEKIEG